MIGKLMMATKAHGDPLSPHSRDISRDEPDLMRVDGEDGDCWVGHWIEGFGFINVYFPKATTRPCTETEKASYVAAVAIAPWGKFKLKNEDFA